MRPDDRCRSNAVSNQKTWAGRAPLRRVLGVPPRPRRVPLRTARSWRGIVSFTHLAREGRMTVTIGRRELLVALGGVAAWPLAARAQQGERTRRVGVLMNLAADDPEGQSRIVAFVQGLQQSGWTDGRNIRIDTRWAAGDADRFHRYAEELLALAPDVILASATFKHCSRRPAPCPSCS